MPYTGIDDPTLPADVQERAADDRQIFVTVFNATYDDCIEDGGTMAECEEDAFPIARSQMNKAWEGFGFFWPFPNNLRPPPKP